MLLILISNIFFDIILKQLVFITKNKKGKLVRISLFFIKLVKIKRYA